MTYCLDVEMFISEVEKYPEIWDLNSEDNRYKSRKQRAWARVAQLFIADFHDMEENEKLDVYKKLHSKWRNIRDSYVRDLKRKDGKRGYMYARHLAFLDNLYKGNVLAEHGSGGEEEEDGEREEEEREWSEEDAHAHGRSVRRRRRRGAGHGAGGCGDPPPAHDEPKRRRTAETKADKIEFVDAPYPEPSSSYAPEDEDRSFFESLLPAVREFDVDQKLEFRSEVIRLLKELRSDRRRFKLDPA